MNVKTLIAGLAGGAVMFGSGFVIYALLFADFFSVDMSGDPPVISSIIIGELIYGVLLAVLFSRMGVATLAEGVKIGALIGFIIGLAVGFGNHGANQGESLAFYFVNAISWAVRWALGGALIGQLLSTKSKKEAAIAT